VYEGIALLEMSGALRPLSTNRRNRIWEATGLLDRVAPVEEGSFPASEAPACGRHRRFAVVMRF
jgi:hypothetical protein